MGLHVMMMPEKMADRVTQLQDAINQMADLFCNSVGILQQSTVDGASKNESGEGGSGGGGEGEGSSEHAPGDVPPEENIKLFSTLITRTAQDIDMLIDSLPSSEYTAEMQVADLRKLDQTNRELTQKLTAMVEQGESMLHKISQTLRDIHDTQLKIKLIQ